MKSKCAQQVRAAAAAVGRTLTDAQLRDIESRIDATMRRLAVSEQGWAGIPRDARVTMAAERAMEDIQAEAARKAANSVRQVLKQADTAGRVDSLADSYKGARGGQAEMLKRDFELTNMYAGALRKDSQGGLMSLIEAAGDKEGAGLGRQALMMVFDAENPRMTADVVREVYANADGSSGNKTASTAARAWLDTIETLRQRFNAAGGDVGRLEYGYTPQPHDRVRIKKAGADTWATEVLPLLDRRRYVDTDGRRLNDDEVADILRGAWQTITTDGLLKQEPGAFKGSGKRANRGGDERQIHFKDGEAWLAYNARFGRGSLYDAMMGHIAGITRDIALVERYGPDPEATARLQFDLAARADGTDPQALVGAGSVDPQTYWSMITGKTGMPKNETLARAFETARNIQVAAKLGGAVISSVTDLGTLAITAGYNRLPYWQLVKDIGTAATADAKDFMSAHGMIADSIADSMNRWSGDHMGHGWSGKLANSTMRWSLMNAWTDSLRQGFTLTMNAGLARMAQKTWGALDEFDRVRLQRAGITEADWQTLQGVKLAQFNGRQLLTPQGIKDAGQPELAARVFAFINDEAEMAVLAPDMATRAITTMGGQQAGTWGGEIARTVMQFKSFPIAMITRHWRRMFDDVGGSFTTADRFKYAMAMLVTTVGLGAIATQAKQILAGKDPIDMTDEDTAARFLAKAAMQGGGLSILGDLFLTDPSATFGDQAANAIKNVAGPTVGSATELLFKNIAGNIWEAADGKDTHWQAEAAAWVRSNTPGASVWWVKPAIDHGFLNAMNENLSPGYLSRMQQRAYKDWEQRYWWAPRDGLPARAPDIAGAFGQ
jgi:hypothetical protein